MSDKQTFNPLPNVNSDSADGQRRSETRRDFLKKSAIVGATAAIPYFLTSSSAGAVDLNRKPTIAAIGVGGSRGAFNRGREIANEAARQGQLIAVCDADELHAAEFNKQFDSSLNVYTDYRKLFDKEKPDVVTIGTPDHWHVPIAIRALESGADVYCEKPLTLTLAEGALIRKAVEKSGRVFQVGTQQRSEMNHLFLYAVAIVRSGRLGDKVNAHVGIDGAPTGGPFAETEAPLGLDWDLWLGPAAKQPYSDERRKSFRWYFEYSGGKMTDWGAHHIDIAQWALGLDRSGPISIGGNGKLTPIIPDDFNWHRFLDGELTLPNAYNTATEFHLNLDFAEGNRITVNHAYESGSTNFGNGILFEGENGRMFVNRGKLQGTIVQQLFGANLEQTTNADGSGGNNYADAIGNLDQSIRDEFDTAFKELHKGKKPMSHMQNFFGCLEDRSQPVSDVATHVRTMASCHLCNVALMLGRELKWDPKGEDFGGDDQANALMTRHRRTGFET